MMMHIRVLRVHWLSDLSEIKDVCWLTFRVSFIMLSKIKKLFVISILVVLCHVVVRLLFIFVHMSPFSAHMLHNIMGWPVRVLLFKFFPVFLAEVDVSGEWFLGASDFSLCLHVRAHRFFLFFDRCFFNVRMGWVKFVIFQRSGWYVEGQVASFSWGLKRF